MIRELRGITGIRGIIAFIIAYLFHYYSIFGVLPDTVVWMNCFLGKVSSYGLMMPDMFFWLSGFLMMYIYHERIESGMTFKEYLIPKVIKCQPLVIITAIFTFSLQRVGKLWFGEFPLHSLGAPYRESIGALLLNLTGLQCGIISNGDTMATNGPSWFVTVLFICYILYYVVVKNIKKLTGQILVFALIMICGITCLLLDISFPLLYSCVCRGYIGFFGGVLLFQATKYVKKEHIGFLAAVSIGLIIVGIKLYIPDVSARSFIIVNLLLWPEVLYLGVFCKPIVKILGCRCLEQLGRISMSIFLWNLPTDILIIICNKRLNLNLAFGSVKVWMAHVILSLMIAGISYVLIEKRFTKKINAWWRNKCEDRDAEIQGER